MATCTQITADMLRAKGACEDQHALFNELFPNGSPKSRRAALTAAKRHAGKFDWGWAAKNLLSESAGAQYEAATAPAWAQYKAARGDAWAQYEAARDAAWAQYKAATAPAWAQYEAAGDAAWAQYEAATAPAWAQYKAAMAAAFINALCDEGMESKP
jgi:hypothetical protein